MIQNEARSSVVQYWMRKADDSLASARSEFSAGRLDFAVNRSYYACFYAASAYLLMLGKKFVKHSGVRGAIHQDLVRSGTLDAKWGKAFDHLFENRQAGDYLVLYEFEKAQVAEMLEQAEGFIGEIKKLLDKQA
ncbi:MAG: HEPN domain-containing protein [Sulfuricaulis sp.]|nr:HEPN domain-containing protein [Sulfuricaulis sp.]